MKIFDCTTYFDEPLLFEARLNILNDYVDKFIVSEATYTHSGEKKKINFNKNDYPNFKKKIAHIVTDREPDNLFKINKNEKLSNALLRLNAIERIKKQRNQILSYFNKDNLNDWIIYSDSDEIPDLSRINFNKSKKKIILFKQKIFYYKFNLSLDSQTWYGSKACRFKDLTSISKLRNVKSKKFGWWRIDTLFKDNKFINLQIVDDGGWHFTQIKNAKEIYHKNKNDEHHDEFDLTGISINDIKNMIDNMYITYDSSIEKIDLNKKWNKNNRIYLTKINDNKLPKYLIKNKSKYLEWFA